MDKATLTTPRLPTADIPIKDVGTVRARGLSRQEVLDLRAKDTSGPGVFERHLLAVAMIDPPMTVEDVEAWQAASPPHEVETVVKAVGGMSAMEPGAAKEAYKEIAADADAQFRVSPRPDADDDGGTAPSGDAS